VGGDAKTADPSRFRFVAVDGENIIAPAAGMGDMIGATSDGAAVPGVDDVESDRGVDADGGMEGRGRLPGPVANAADKFFFYACCHQRNATAVDQQHIPGAIQSF